MAANPWFGCSPTVRIYCEIGSTSSHLACVNPVDDCEIVINHFDPTYCETIHKIEEKIHVFEDVAQEKLHDLGERLHLTAKSEDESTGKEKEKAAQAGKD